MISLIVFQETRDELGFKREKKHNTFFLRSTLSLRLSTFLLFLFWLIREDHSSDHCLLRHAFSHRVIPPICLLSLDFRSQTQKTIFSNDSLSISTFQSLIIPHHHPHHYPPFFYFSATSGNHRISPWIDSHRLSRFLSIPAIALLLSPFGSIYRRRFHRLVLFQMGRLYVL